MRRRASLGIAALVLLAGQRGVVADEPPGRAAWVYSASGKSGSFRSLTGRRWVERTPDGASLRFEEVGRTDEHVELFDAGRSMRVRLHADRAEWRQGEDPAWHGLYPGRWVDPDQLPRPPAPDLRIRLVYFVPADREPTPGYEAKIRVVMRVVSELYRQDAESHGRRGVRLRFQGEDGAPTVHLVRGAHPAANYNGAPDYDGDRQWGRILPEIPEAIGRPAEHLLIIFAETYDDGPAPFEWPGGVALGQQFSANGGVGLFSAWILRPEFAATTFERQRRLLFDETPIRGRIALGHGRADSPRFEFIEDGMGAVAHELGHALGLPHDTRRDDLDIMGNGFRHLRENFRGGRPPRRRVGFSDDNARVLYASRYLAPDADLSDDVGPTARLRWSAIPKPGAATVRVAVEAEDETGLRAVLFYSPSQGSVVGGRALSGTRQAFEQALDVQPVGPEGLRLEATVVDVGGNLSHVELGPGASN